MVAVEGLTAKAEEIVDAVDIPVNNAGGNDCIRKVNLGSGIITTWLILSDTAGRRW